MGKWMISLALASLVVATEVQAGGMLPLFLLLVALLVYSLVSRQHVTLNADPQEAHQARARVAANAVPCDWVKPE